MTRPDIEIEYEVQDLSGSGMQSRGDFAAAWATVYMCPVDPQHCRPGEKLPHIRLPREQAALFRLGERVRLTIHGSEE